MNKRLCALALVVAALGCAAPAAEPEPVASDESELWGIGEDPQAWRSFWYAKYQSHLGTPTEPGRALAPFKGTHLVLLIPGTTIGPEFFGPMEARLRRDGFDVVVWAPPDLFTDSLWKGAERIGEEVQKLLASRGASRLHIVAQCDAGVATRYYTEVLGGDRYIDQLVTFVSAHHGTEAAPVGAWWTGWPALSDIKPWSDVIAKSNAAPPRLGRRFTSIYSCHDEFMYPYTTSRVEGATNVELCGIRMGHFEPFWNPTVYDRILVTLRGEGDGAPLWY